MDTSGFSRAQFRAQSLISLVRNSAYYVSFIAAVHVAYVWAPKFFPSIIHELRQFKDFVSQGTRSEFCDGTGIALAAGGRNVVPTLIFKLTTTLYLHMI